MQHSPKLHIFIGRDNHFFTLRESYLHTYYIGRVNPKPVYEVRYSHIKNLSQNWDEALEKAREAALNLGIPLHVRESEIEQLDEIKRISAEEKEQQDRLRQEEYAKAEEEAQARRRAWWNTWKDETLNTLEGIRIEEFNISGCELPEGFIEKITNNGWAISNRDPEIYIRIRNDQPRTMVGGAYHNHSFENIPTSYLQWMVYTSGLCDIDAEETMHKAAFVAQWIRDNLDVKPPVESNWVGNEGEKIEQEVEIDSVRTTNGYYGMSYMYKLLTAEGNQLVWFASRDALAGYPNKVKLKFTVKKHSEYNGTKQTVITRAKVA